jgi:predicted RNase H-like nuclease
VVPLYVSTVLGVDGCKLGWVGIELHGGSYVAAHVDSSLGGLVAAVPDAVAIGVDIPLGLMAGEVRASDRAAKRRLGARSSSLFVMPPRPVFDAPHHAAATAMATALTGTGISIQTWQLRRKFLEAEELHDQTPLPLHEVHPELSFREMGLLTSDGRKKSWRGQRARLRILAEHGIDIPEDLGAAVAAVAADDVLDAAAAAWSAQRIATGSAFSLPDPPQVNERGRRLAIWC